MAFVDVVDDQDVVSKTISESDRSSGDILRAAVVLLYSQDGGVFLQRRSLTDDSYAGHLDFTAGGGVDAGESYAVAAMRELQEEVGVQVPLTFVRKELFTYPDGSKEFCALFTGVFDGDFSVNQEVEEMVKVDPKTFVVSAHKVHPELLFFIEKFGLFKDH